MGVGNDDSGFCAAIFGFMFFRRTCRQVFEKKVDNIIGRYDSRGNSFFCYFFPKISDGTPILLALVRISAIRSVGTGIQTPAVNAAVTQLVPQDKLMKFNGYRVYTEQDLQRLKTIRSLRCANYSLEAILQLLQQLSKNSQTDVRSALNTPRRSDDIISVCARLIVSLSSAERNAFRVSELLLDMKNKFQ